MSITVWRIAGPALLFILIFLSGFWLSKSGKPFNTIILTAHKLIALATAVFFVITIFQTNKASRLSGPEVIAGTATVLFFLGAIVSGGLLSTGKSMPAAILTLHRILPYLTVAANGVTLFLLLGSKS